MSVHHPDRMTSIRGSDAHDLGIGSRAESRAPAAGGAWKRRIVLIVHEHPGTSQALAGTVGELGHSPRVSDEGFAAAEVETGGAPTPDVALVGYVNEAEQALAVIGTHAGRGAYPVLAVLPGHDADFTRSAAARGVFACLARVDRDTLDAAIEVAAVRFRQYVGLKGAFARRATVEQAKGILMALHGVEEDVAFDLIRSHARRHSRRVVDVATAVLTSHQLLNPPHGDSE